MYHSRGQRYGPIERLQCTTCQLAHQVPCAVLCILQRQAYDLYTNNKDIPSEVNDLIQEQSRAHPQIAYRETVFKLERLPIMLLKAQPEDNYPLYIEALRGIVQWLCVTEHYNYEGG